MMSRTVKKWCRICLSNNKDDNISHASRYAEFLYQLTNNKYTEEIWLCMWCRNILQKTITLKRLALASEQLLQSLNEVPYGLQNNKHIPRLSHTSVVHINVPSDHNDKLNIEVMILNESNKINDENITPKIVQQSVNSIQSECINDNLTEIRLQKELNTNEVIIGESNHSIDFLNEEIEYTNENDSLSQNINKRLSENNELITKQENENEYHVQRKENKNKINKQMKLTKSNKKVPKESKIDLKLEKLKFEVRYLNLKEQIKEVELKKNKYKDKQFQCESCGVGFLTNDYFEQHKIRHTEAAGQHKCNICSLHFKTTQVLSQHLLSHKRIFSCTTCGARFGKWSNCVVHRQKCGATVLYVECETCHKVFSDAHSLKVHARLHRLLRQFSCEQCDASFTTRQKLAVHARSHSGVKPFSCPLCARCFTTNSNLRAHGAVHSSRPEHYCVQCDTRYKTAKSLHRHLRESARHARERSHVYKCTECGKEFPTSKSLQCHLARHSDGLQEIKCPQCDKSFSSKSNLSKHLKCIHKHVLTSAHEK